jgi:hypothetical protein
MDSIFASMLIAQIEGLGSATAARESVRKARPEIAERVVRELDFIERRSAVPAGTTVSWAPSAPGREFFQLIQRGSIFGALTHICRHIPWHVDAPREAGAGADAAWRSEGIPRPIRSTISDTVRLDYRSLDTAFVISREIARFGVGGERAVSQIATNAVARAVDRQLLDPAISTSLTYGCEQISLGGSAASDLVAALSGALAAITPTAGQLRWAMAPTTLARVAARLAGVGLRVTAEDLLSIPVLVSSSVPAGLVVLLDADAIILAFDDNVEVDVNVVGSVEMVDSPTQDATTGAGTSSLVSLWQTGMAGVLAALAAAWTHTSYNTGSPSQPNDVVFLQLD